MKTRPYLAIAVACMFLVLIGLVVMAYAACPSPDGKTYCINGCSVVFHQAPFGPGEFGIAVVDCAGNLTTYDYECSPDKCVIDIMQDGQHVIYLFQVGDNMLLSDYPGMIRE